MGENGVCMSLRAYMPELQDIITRLNNHPIVIVGMEMITINNSTGIFARTNFRRMRHSIPFRFCGSEFQFGACGRPEKGKRRSGYGCIWHRVQVHVPPRTQEGKLFIAFGPKKFCDGERLVSRAAMTCLSSDGAHKNPRKMFIKHGLQPDLGMRTFVGNTERRNQPQLRISFSIKSPKQHLHKVSSHQTFTDETKTDYELSEWRQQRCTGVWTCKWINRFRSLKF